MPRTDFSELLRRAGIQPSAQRVAIAKYVLRTKKHPTADEVWKAVRKDFPYVSRATVYNTLRLFVEKGLLKHYCVDEAGSVFDPNTDKHHHFVDEETGDITDVPWERLTVKGLDSLRFLVGMSGVEVNEYMVVIRGRKSGKSGKGGRSGKRGKSRGSEEHRKSDKGGASGRSAARGRHRTIGHHHRRKEEEL
jgi:Fur family iron response transcriptional regulator